jgi:hypothetical protein
MKKSVLIFSALVAFFLMPSCQKASTEMESNYPSDYDIAYQINKVTEYDPVNVTGIDVSSYFDFFSTLRFTIHYKDGKMSTLEFNNADIPFSPFSFEIPQGTVNCYFDDTVSPNAIKIKDTNNVIAYYKNGEICIPFQLDSKQLKYIYTFKKVSE